MTTEQAPAKRRRGFETSADMVRSLLVVVAIVAVVVALRVEPNSGPTVRRFDYSGVVQQARIQAPYDVLAPVGLPRAWRATSGRAGADDGSGSVTWHLGFVTPSGDYAGIEQSNGAPVRVLARVSGGASPAGRVVIRSATWRRVTGGDPEPKALVLEGQSVTTVVAGRATWRELRTLAASLRGGS